MAVNESDVREYLPSDIDDQPSGNEISNKITLAENKVDMFDGLSEDQIQLATELWSAYLILELKYQKPQSADRTGNIYDYRENLADRLKDRFYDVVGNHYSRQPLDE